jgi:hypothetical protein
MVVYKVEKSNILMLLQIYWDLELKVSSKSFEVFNIHIEYPQVAYRNCKGSRGHNGLVVGFKPLTITTNVASLNLFHGEVTLKVVRNTVFA